MSSQSPSAQLMTPAFKFEVVGRMTKNEAVEDSHARRKRQKKAELDLLAIGYSEEMLLLLVHTARTTKDERLRRDCANDVLNRGLGRAKPTTEEQQKGNGAENLLEILASLSRTSSASEQEARRIAHTPKDITPTDPASDLEGFFKEIDNEGNDHE